MIERPTYHQDHITQNDIDTRPNGSSGTRLKLLWYHIPDINNGSKTMKGKVTPRQARYMPIEHDGETHTLQEWSKKIGMSPMTLYNRVYQYGWSIERALTTPAQYRRRPFRSIAKHRRDYADTPAGIY